MEKRNNLNSRLVIIITFFVCTANSDLYTQSTFDFFAEKEILEITLSTDFKEVIVNKEDDRYRLATIMIQSDKITKDPIPIQIKPRGAFRRNFCSFPPIQLNLEDSDLDAGKGLNDKLKMVTHCKDGATFESYILKEYLIYELLQVLTEKSFKRKIAESQLCRYWAQR